MVKVAYICSFLIATEIARKQFQWDALMLKPNCMQKILFGSLSGFEFGSCKCVLAV